MAELENGADAALPLPSQPRKILSYSSAVPGATVIVARFGSELEAALPLAELASEGILCQMLNGNVNSLGFHFRGFTDVELHVHEGDAEHAREVLARVNASDLEPAEELSLPTLPPGDDGEPIRLEFAGAFESVRAMREAQTVLASGRIRSFPPALVRRGDAAPGKGKRFVLRVSPEDLDRARAMLREADEEADDSPQGRCPRCGSWRLYPVSDLWKMLLSTLRLAPRWEPQIECLACRHRGPKAEFDERRSSQ